MEDYTMIAKVYSLVAEMEALKAEIETLKREWPTGGEHFFQEKADQLNNIASALQMLGVG